MTPDERHEDVVRRHPGGLTPIQFRHETLASVDEDGKLDPPALADWFKQQSLLMGMWFEGLIEKRGHPDKAGPWFIADKGRIQLRGRDAITDSESLSPVADAGVEGPKS